MYTVYISTVSKVVRLSTGRLGAQSELTDRK